MERERKMYGVLCMPTACWIQPSYGETTENEDTWKKVKYSQNYIEPGLYFIKVKNILKSWT